MNRKWRQSRIASSWLGVCVWWLKDEWIYKLMKPTGALQKICILLHKYICMLKCIKSKEALLSNGA